MSAVEGLWHEEIDPSIAHEGAKVFRGDYMNGGYDQEFDWYEDDRDIILECDCSDYDTDLVEGSAKCWRCGRSWTLTSAEMEAEFKAIREHDEEMERGRRWSWFWEIYWKVRSWLTRKPIPSAHGDLDDEIPF